MKDKQTTQPRQFFAYLVQIIFIVFKKTVLFFAGLVILAYLLYFSYSFLQPYTTTSIYKELDNPQICYNYIVLKDYNACIGQDLDKNYCQNSFYNSRNIYFEKKYSSELNNNRAKIVKTHFINSEACAAHYGRECIRGSTQIFLNVQADALVYIYPKVDNTQAAITLPIFDPEKKPQMRRADGTIFDFDKTMLSCVKG
jgi:hypothetical protein